MKLDFKFNPNKSFIELHIVWFVVLTITFTALIITFAIITNTPLKINFSSNGFNTFISVFKFPLGLLALIIPIVALLSANHRSEQTREQIRLTTMQNSFANYYKHIEEFQKVASKIYSNETASRNAHKILFPLAHEGNYEINNKIISDYISICDRTMSELAKDSPDLNSITPDIHEFSVKIMITEKKNKPVEYISQENGYRTIHNCLVKFEYIISFLNYIPEGAQNRLEKIEIAYSKVTLQ